MVLPMPVLLLASLEAKLLPPLGKHDSPQCSRAGAETDKWWHCATGLQVKVKGQCEEGLREQHIQGQRLPFMSDFGKRDSTGFFKGSRAPLSSPVWEDLEFLPLPTAVHYENIFTCRNLVGSSIDQLNILCLCLRIFSGLDTQKGPMQPMLLFL